MGDASQVVITNQANLIAALEATLATVERDAQVWERRVQEAADAVERLEMKLATVERERDEANDMVVQLVGREKTLQADVERLQGERAIVDGEIKHLCTLTQGYKEQLIALDAEAERLRREDHLWLPRFDDLLAKHQALERENAALKGDVERTDAALKNTMMERDMYRLQAGTRGECLADALDRIATLEAAREALEAELRETQEWLENYVTGLAAGFGLTVAHGAAHEVLVKHGFAIEEHHKEHHEREDAIERDRARLQGQVDTLFDAIKHGDEKHQAWLRDKIGEHFEAKHALGGRDAKAISGGFHE